ncbi:hypothetical protein ABIF38_006504 [Bradyrhizobium japonicum]|jgi:hypothetical protein|uniref:Uncharacterized protein n=1 Tax=Bradyrhizobium elkanii TaxID=29448 RepID=A0ABV4F1H9_BRAEL|nr:MULTISPECIES: hypothetical protein [Bradyrhizobium]MBP2426584.1 hypothetical protein [Bradyrhizobium elkanii]MCP1731188.1 hypothetical protein [Bradyrhizobium elkanii]MCP1758171.1 hypothetical protein [Bradyrhizobium elkanii]MCP1931744.1 hypothetical protein [Bradyrhizobium elkanii]MCP1969729.1 hypothetical protein [Bradyrhizobium elkanii]
MIDPLFARAELAIEESQTLREQRKSLTDQRDEQLAELRQSVHNSASARTEIKAHRDNCK